MSDPAPWRYATSWQMRAAAVRSANGGDAVKAEHASLEAAARVTPRQTVRARPCGSTRRYKRHVHEYEIHVSSFQILFLRCSAAKVNTLRNRASLRARRLRCREWRLRLKRARRRSERMRPAATEV
eukprot:4695480-Pleurochrysis_carterae.AAC.2